MIETERLLLRPHIADDFEACRAMWQDPAVVKYISGKPATEAEAWLRFLGYFGRWEIMGYGLFALIEKSTGQFMGEWDLATFGADLGPISIPSTRRHGFWLKPGTAKATPGKP